MLRLQLRGGLECERWSSSQFSDRHLLASQPLRRTRETSAAELPAVISTSWRLGPSFRGLSFPDLSLLGASLLACDQTSEANASSWIVLDRFSGRLVAFDRRGFARSRRFTPFGLDGFGGFDGFGDFGGFGGFNENPAVVSIPRAATEATQPAPTRIAGDLPPCRETMAGVVINRGGACSRAPLSAGPSTDPPRDVPR